MIKKKEPGALKTSMISSESELKTLLKFPFAARIEIEDEDITIAEIEKEITAMDVIRTEWGLPEKWQKARDQYEGKISYKDFPWDDCSNLHIHITSMAVDVINTKAQAQMFVSPMMLLKPLPGQFSDTLYEDISLKEKFLDYKLQQEIEIEEKTDPIIQDAINIGTGIAKVSHSREIDYEAVVSEIYEPTKRDVRNFINDFKNDKHTPVYRRYLKDLIGRGTEEDPAGIPIEVWLQSDEITYDNPKISYVKLEDLHVRPDISDINKQRVIAEDVKFTWIELCNLVSTGYIHNKQVLKILRDKYKNDYYKKIYEGRESIYYYDYEKTNNPKRVVITYLKNEKISLRAVTFPYSHRKAYYVFYYIKKVPGSIYGEGLAERLEHTNKALNNLWNQVVDAGTLRNAPAFKAVKGSDFDPSRKKYAPAVIWWVKLIGDVESFPVYGMSEQMINIINKLERYAEWQTGVSAYATGRESPTDPNAPASKAFMLLKESGLRTNKMTRQLHKGNQQVYEMCDKLIYQHTKHNQIPFIVKKSEQIESIQISKKILGMKVQYIPQLSDITVNKEIQKTQDMQFGQYLMPLLGSVPTAQRTILEIQIRNQGGAWEKEMDKLLPPSKVQMQQTIPALPPGAGTSAAGTFATPAP